MQMKVLFIFNHWLGQATMKAAKERVDYLDHHFEALFLKLIFDGNASEA